MCLAKHGKGMLFSITRSSSFSVIHVSVNIKNNADKDMALLFFFLSKSPGAQSCLPKRQARIQVFMSPDFVTYFSPS